MSWLDIIKEYFLIILESLIALTLLIINTFFSQIEKYQKVISWCVFGLLIMDILIKLIDKLKSKQDEKELKKENEEKSEKQDKSLEIIKRQLDGQKQ